MQPIAGVPGEQAMTEPRGITLDAMPATAFADDADGRRRNAEFLCKPTPCFALPTAKQSIAGNFIVWEFGDFAPLAFGGSHAK